MNLIPIDHNISTEAEQIINNAILYESAGMDAKAEDLKYKALTIICRENEIETISVSGRYIYGIKSKYRGWAFVYAKNYLEDVPIEVLNKMSKIGNKERFAILSPRDLPDPVLIYDTGITHNGNEIFIKLAEWE